MNGLNEVSIERVASTILSLLGVEKEKEMTNEIEMVTKERKCDRVIMYNPDAVAEWIYEAHRDLFAPVLNKIDLNLEMLSMVPPVTPVCFASMYSGLLPERHGIREYVKPILKCRTVFDCLSEKGKKCAIVSTEGDSISRIFLERNIDYFIYKTKKECNEKAFSLIDEDKYDLIVLYNGDYDYYMHRFSPEGKRSLRALKENIETYSSLIERVKEKWKGHSAAIAFAPDHGCHKWLGLLGNHGEKIPKDMNIRHFWTFVS